MISMGLDVVNSVLNFFLSITTKLGVDLLFVIGLGLEVLLVLFFLIKSASSYEVSLNRALDKLNYWLFQKKVVNEENIRSLNMLFKTKAPKRLTYYWHQYVLFREGTPSSYFTADNVIDKQVKTSSFSSDIKNLAIFTAVWGVLSAVLVFICLAYDATILTGAAISTALLLGFAIALIGTLFVVYMRARRNSVVASLYQSLSLFNRFMDNACMDLPTYVDYQILFTPAEIEKGQPVLREFLDFKARKEKEEFTKAKEEQIDYVSYDFSETGVDGSIVLERAMRESELFLNRREKLLIQISQLEAELESRKKNFDNIQRDSQTKIQASKENIARLRQMQEETTNRIESNYYRKQQTQEASKQEQLEQEFEQQRAKYLLEKGEVEEEIKKLNEELEGYRKHVEDAMLGEYKTFFDKFCHSAEKVVAKVFGEKLDALKAENEKDKAYITELELQIKNMPQVSEQPAEEGEAPADGTYDANGNYVYANGTYYDPQGNFHDAEGNVYAPDGTLIAKDQPVEVEQEHYDENGNYVYPNGTYYDPQGNFHDTEGNVYSQDGALISKAQPDEPKQEHVVDLDSFDTFEFMTDVEQKEDVYNVAENVINELDTDNEIKVVQSEKQEKPVEKEEPVQEEPAPVEEAPAELETFSLEEEQPAEEPAPVEEEPAEEIVEEEPEEPEDEFEDFEEKPTKRVGRPRKIVKEEEPVVVKKPGRPRKEQPVVVKNKVGRPKKVVETPKQPKNKVGRPKKVVKEEPKKRVGRPRKEQPVVVKNKVGRPKKVVEAPKQPKNKVGRPRKVVEEEPKKRVGRPRKEQPVVVKNKVGRPKKVVEAPKQPKNKVGRPRKVVEEEPKKQGRGRPRKNDKLNEINRRLSEEEAKLAEMRRELNAELEDAMIGVNGNNKDKNQERRTQIMKEIDSLQIEAQKVMQSENSETKMREINERLETLLDEIKDLND